MFTTIKKVIFTARFLWNAFGEYHAKIAIMAILGFVSGLFGGIGISIIIPLFSILSPKNGIASDFITQSIQKIFSVINIPFTVPYLFLFIAKAGVTFLAKYYNEVAGSLYEKNTRVKLFRETLASTWPNLLEYKLGFLERVLSYDIQRSTDLFTSTGNIAITLTSLIAYGIVAINLSLMITLAMIAFGIALLFLMKPIFYKTRKLAAMIADIYKVVSHHINESMVGAKIIKANAIEQQVVSVAERHFENLRIIRVKNVFPLLIPLAVQWRWL